MERKEPDLHNLLLSNVAFQSHHGSSFTAAAAAAAFRPLWVICMGVVQLNQENKGTLSHPCLQTILYWLQAFTGKGITAALCAALLASKSAQAQRCEAQHACSSYLAMLHAACRNPSLQRSQADMAVPKHQAHLS